MSNGKSLFQYMLDRAPPIPGPGVYMKVSSHPFADDGYEAELLVVTENGKYFIVDCQDGDLYEVEPQEGRSPDEIARYDAVELRPLNIAAFRRAWGSDEEKQADGT